MVNRLIKLKSKGNFGEGGGELISYFVEAFSKNKYLKSFGYSFVEEGSN